MNNIIEVQTDRLRLRQWRQDDFKPFAELNSNKNVMAFFPELLSPSQSDELATSFQHRIATNGWGFWAVEIPNEADFIGFVGLNRPTYDLPFAKPIEIGWRLSDKYWHQGFATEAALAALRIGFKQLEFTEIVAFTSLLNNASINVMSRLKMKNSNYLFEHPKIPTGHTLSQHCLYKITLENWSLENRD